MVERIIPGLEWLHVCRRSDLKGDLTAGLTVAVMLVPHSSHPRAAELGYLEKDNVFHDIKRFPEAKTYPYVLILRVDASLYFANMKFLEDLLRRGIEEKPEVRWIVIDLSAVNDIDAVAIHTLDDIIDTYRERNINFAFAAMKGPVRDLVAKAGWNEKYGERMEYPSIQHALREIGIT